MSDNKQIIIHRTIDAPPHQVFEVLSNPERHVELDGSGFVRSVDQSDRITHAGQVFRMNMAGDHMGGEYQTDNVVSGYDENKLVAWKTAPAGSEPPGWEWMYELAANGTDATDVTLTYDWRHVSDPEILKLVTFPLVSQEQLESSLGNLAAAVAG